MDDLLTLDDALRMTTEQNASLHRRHLNPRLASLFELIGASVPVTRAKGALYWDANGREYLDFLSGFGTSCLGYNDARLEEALDRVRALPNISEALSHLSAALAHNLACLAPPPLTRSYFACSGAEVIDSAIKLARAATGRPRLVACRGAFHGRTIGALSMMDEPLDRALFEPLLADVDAVPFGDADALERVLRRGDVAGFIVEPIQGEGGIVVPPPGYLRDASELCRRYGALLIADEVQTGLGRTGRMFAVEHEGVVPDVLLLGKALGGGIVPISALLTTDRVFKASRSGTRRTALHSPSYGGHARGCAVALATLGVLVAEDLPARAAELGVYMLERLGEIATRAPLIGAVRGRGLLIGIELAPATRGGLTLLTAGVINRISRQHLSGMVLLRLRQQHGIMTGFTLQNRNVLRLQPPLTIDRAHVDRALASLEETLHYLGNFPKAVARSWGTVRRAARARREPAYS